MRSAECVKKGTFTQHAIRNTNFAQETKPRHERFTSRSLKSIPFSAMMTTLRSIWSWAATLTLIVCWVPVLGLIRLSDRDPVRYRTGYWFRRLGAMLTKVNPTWNIQVSGEPVTDPRRPYVVVSNHLSNADVPLISTLPWDMKWIAKDSLFRVPAIGWMMKMAGDIPVDRKDRRSGVLALQRARWYLQNRSSVMFFPEGTRSRDGRMQRFKDGAFKLAIKTQTPILPLVLDGSQTCLPKNSWKFGDAPDIRLRVLPPIETEGLTPQDTTALRERIRRIMVDELAAMRRTAPDAVDRLAEVPQKEAQPG